MSKLRTVFSSYRYDKKHVSEAHDVATHHILNPQSNLNVIDVRDEHFAYLDVPRDWTAKLKQFEAKHGLEFTNPVLLKCALTHSGFIDPNYARTHRLPIERMCNRSFETLGDSILGMIVSSYLFQAYGEFLEGQVTKLRSAIVNNKMLSQVCTVKLEMNDLILVPEHLSEPSSSTSYVVGRETVQAGAVESLIGAIFLDKGMDAAGEFVYKNVVQYALSVTRTELLSMDPISEFQIRIQKKYGRESPTIEYRKGIPGQIKLFLGDQNIATATCRSYKEAKVEVATEALRQIDELLGQVPYPHAVVDGWE